MNLVQGDGRQQRSFLPECLEDYVAEDNPVRFLDAFVESLDLAAAGFISQRRTARTGAAPAIIPVLCLSSICMAISTSYAPARRLEAECSRNLEVIWLLGKLRRTSKPSPIFARTMRRCPAGQSLTKRREMLDKGRRLFNYDHPAACAQCKLKHRCTEAKYRTLSRWEPEACKERW